MNRYPEFGMRLNDLLTEQDRSPAWLARRLGVNGGTVSRWLNDGARPGSPETVARITDVLGITAQRARLLVAAGYGYLDGTTSPPTSGTTQIPPTDVSPHTNNALPPPSAMDVDSRDGRGNLPQPLTPFVGRDAEVARLVQEVRDPACRLLTLIGPGGIGKTRLALEVARQLSTTELSIQGSPFADGVVFVSLLEVASPSQIDFAIAAALGLTLTGQKAAREQLLSLLQNKCVLLLLDNFEHLHEGTEVVAQMLAHAPNMKAMVTSRSALGVTGEWFHPVTGLDAPGDIDVSTEELATYDSVRLFQECARRASSTFDLTVEARFVRQICRLVEGMPLAIELAAAWLRLLPCARIAQTLTDNLAALTSPLPNAVPRHSSMQLVLSHTWHMLTPHEAAVMEVLAIFQGGFDENAAIEVAKTDLMTLAALAQKSMIRPKSPSAGVKYARYSIHETLRQFANQRITDGTDARVEALEGHSRYYLQVLARQMPRLLNEHQPHAVRELDADYDNIRTAWQWAVEHSQYDNFEHSLEGLFQFLTIRGYIPESIRLLTLTVAQLRMDIAGGISLDSRHFLGRTLMWLGEAYVEEQDAERAIPAIEECMIYLDEDHTPYAREWVMGRIAYLRSLTGNFQEAEQYLLESLEQSYACESIQVYVLHRLSDLEQTRGNYRQSCLFGRQSLVAARSLGRPNRTATILDCLAESEYQLGEFDNAAAHREEALTTWRALGNRLSAAQTLHGLGRVAWFGRGNREEASAHFHEALALYRSVGDDAGSNACLADISSLHDEYAQNIAVQAKASVAQQVSHD